MAAPRVSPPTRALLGLDSSEYARLARLRSPERVQAFVSALKMNHELAGETARSVRGTLRGDEAHCIEAALVAACALWIQGRPPLLMHLDCTATDWPHVVALFKVRGLWGAISKSNGAVLRYRDPVHRTLRELALTYLHEYFDRRGRKTLRSYSMPFDLRRIETAQWVTADGSCQPIDDLLARSRHFPLLTAHAAERLAPRDPFERAAARHVQHPQPARIR